MGKRRLVHLEIHVYKVIFIYLERGETDITRETDMEVGTDKFEYKNSAR